MFFFGGGLTLKSKILNLPLLLDIIEVSVPGFNLV